MFCCPVFIHILYRGVIMDVLKYGAITLLSITAIIIIIFAMRSGKPLKSLLINAMLGIAALAVVDITTRFTGVHIPINQWTAVGSAVYGIPCVCGLLVLQLFI